MQLIEEAITTEELKLMAKEMFGDMVKAVVDIENEIMVVNAELHADQEAFLINNGSKQQNLWGINIYPELEGDDRIEFDSMINLRPSQQNMSRYIENPEIRKEIYRITSKLIK
jgi:hypothetical protein